MKKIYFAISYVNRKLFDKEIIALTDFFSKKNIELMVFVDVYNFTDNQEKKMMQAAFKEIDSCDVLIAELSTKSIGVGIEIGYAYATKTPVIYLKKNEAAYSTTAAGCSKTTINYTHVKDLLKHIHKAFFK